MAALATSLSLNTAGTAVILCCNCGFMTAKKNHTAGCVKSRATGGGKLVVRRGEGDPLPSIASRTRFLRQPPRFHRYRLLVAEGGHRGAHTGAGLESLRILAGWLRRMPSLATQPLSVR